MRPDTHAGTNKPPVLFGEFPRKLATDSCFHGSISPFVNNTWVGFMNHPPYALLRTWTLGSGGTAPSGKVSKHSC